MKVSIIGTGYVGLVTGTCLAESGNTVICIDVDAEKVDSLRRIEIPIYEPGLSELVERNVRNGNLTFTTDYNEGISAAEVIFICVGTPQRDDGSAELGSVRSAAEQMAQYLADGAIVVVKSTVPVGTNRQVAEWILAGTDREIHFASNPEFLKEGAAIDDFTKPDRVVVGVNDSGTADRLEELYRPFLRTERPFLTMSIESAEMTKYAANCMLAARISFINEIANLCERVGANVDEVRRGIGHDQRIGFAFLFPGVGYGGSCFPKDVRALISVAERQGMTARLLRSIDQVNDEQKQVLFDKITDWFGGAPADRTIGVWGLSFKPRTDDIREAPSIVLLNSLVAAGARVRAYDPVAMENARRELGDQITWCKRKYDVFEDADAVAIVTEWNEFRNPDFAYMKSLMRHPVIFDGRNLYEPRRMRELGFDYFGIGRYATRQKGTV